MSITAVQEKPAPSGPLPDRPPALRADIQGLRALAVGLVLIYHLRPDWLPGGFVGVDVFFVISGFLIIGLLVKEIRKTGRIRLLTFYARRIRRLLPAATAVLLVVVAATLVLMPFPRWPAIMQGVVASALNVQNWLMAFVSSDYAHATAAASPVQHYWSLAVEEQFYLLIPAVLVLSIVLSRGKHAVRWGMGAIVVITVASFAYSVLATSTPPGAAYFITPTRLWELGIGGLVAIVLHRVQPGRALRFVLGWAGLVAVLASAFLLTTSMAFPGYIALLPTVGAVAMLLAGTVPDGEKQAFYEMSVPLGMQPLRYLGDISYSLYLWHWPVIVFMLERSLRDQLTFGQVLKALGVSLVLAVLSKHFIEDPFRHPRPRGNRAPQRRTSYALGAALVVVSVIAAAAPWQVAQARIDAAFEASMTLDANHPGAGAFDATGLRAVVDGVSLVPDPAVAEQDVAATWPDNCAAINFKDKPPAGDACVYGNKQADKTMVLVGDSHMTMYSTALINFVKVNQGWRVKMLTHDGCAFGDLPPDRSGYPLPVCGEVARELQPHLIAMKPDLVITSGYTLGSEIVDGKRRWPGRERLVRGYDQLLRPLAEAGIPVAAIRDVPLMTTNTPRCLQKNPGNHSACDANRDAALGPEQDPLIEAVSVLPGARTVDLTDKLCTATACPAVAGNVIVYRDNHLTDAYVRSLSGTLVERLGLA